jgi:hypothetical protein
MTHGHADKHRIATRGQKNECQPQKRKPVQVYDKHESKNGRALASAALRTGRTMSTIMMKTSTGVGSVKKELREYR